MRGEGEIRNFKELRREMEKSMAKITDITQERFKFQDDIDKVQNELAKIEKMVDSFEACVRARRDDWKRIDRSVKWHYSIKREHRGRILELEGLLDEGERGVEEIVIEYKCGHKTNTAFILDDNSISVSAHLEWSNTVGIFGDKSLCFDCWAKKRGEGVKE